MGPRLRLPSRPRVTRRFEGWVGKVWRIRHGQNIKHPLPNFPTGLEALGGSGRVDFGKSCEGLSGECGAPSARPSQPTLITTCHPCAMRTPPSWWGSGAARPGHAGADERAKCLATSSLSPDPALLCGGRRQARARPGGLWCGSVQ